MNTVTVKYCNPYLDSFNKITGGLRNRDMLLAGVDRIVDEYKFRQKLINQYSYAIPDEEALEAIKKHSPNGVVEIGAGTGYWALMLSQIGVKVAAYENNSSHYEGRHGHFYPIMKGNAASVENHPSQTLFLCWPPMSSMAVDALSVYAGDTCVYIGEHEWGCTADQAFFDMLSQRWEEVETVEIPQWMGIHDRMYVFKRKELLLESLQSTRDRDNDPTT